MTAAPPRRPWWKKRRAWVAGALILTTAYPTSFLALQYIYGRGLIRSDGPVDRTLSATYAPMNLALFGPDGPRPLFERFTFACYDAYRIGELHRKRAESD